MKPGVCSKCGISKPIGVRCKPCQTAVLRAYYAKNRESILAYKARFHRANTENRSKYMSDRYLKKREELCEKSRTYYSKNEESVKARLRAKYLECRDAVALRRKSYRVQNSEKLKAANKKWRMENRDKIYALIHRRRAIKASAAGFHTATEWAAVLAKFGNKCAVCGSRDRLTKDHIVPLGAGGTDFAYNLQPLCSYHNSSKGARIPKNCQHSIFDNIQMKMAGSMT